MLLIRITIIVLLFVITPISNGLYAQSFLQFIDTVKYSTYAQKNNSIVDFYPSSGGGSPLIYGPDNYPKAQIIFNVFP